MLKLALFSHTIQNSSVSEYSCFTSLEACSEALAAYNAASDEKVFGGSSDLQVDPGLMSFYQPPVADTSSFPFCVKLETVADVADALNNNYHLIKGKAYNNRLVFSSNFTRMVAGVIRSFTRYVIWMFQLLYPHPLYTLRLYPLSIKKPIFKCLTIAAAGTATFA